MGCHALLQGIFLTQGLNPHLLHILYWQAGSLPLVPPGKRVSRLMFKPAVWEGWLRVDQPLRLLLGNLHQEA